MNKKSNIYILAMNNFFDPVKAKLQNNYNVINCSDLSCLDTSIEGIITTPWSKVDAELINALPSLKIISCFGVGIDNVDQKTAIEKGIVITNTPHIVTEDTANLAITLMLCLSRNIIYNDKYVKSGNWKISSPPLGTSISNKTLGIVGLGNIGKRIAEKALSFGLKIVYYSKTQKDVPYQFYDNLISMAEETNFLVVSCIGNNETNNIINLDILKALGKKGYLINISRGTTVNENDLIYALKNNIIAGAGLDVYLNEPNINEELFTIEHVVLLPHIGTATNEARAKMLNLVVENIKSFFETGKALTPVIFNLN